MKDEVDYHQKLVEEGKCKNIRFPALEVEDIFSALLVATILIIFFDNLVNLDKHRNSKITFGGCSLV